MADMCGLEPHAAKHKGSSPLLPTSDMPWVIINKAYRPKVCGMLRAPGL